jgi:hypothetical protein
VPFLTAEHSLPALELTANDRLEIQHASRRLDVFVDVDVDVITPVIVADHVNVNATLDVIGSRPTATGKLQAFKAAVRRAQRLIRTAKVVKGRPSTSRVELTVKRSATITGLSTST